MKWKKREWKEKRNGKRQKSLNLLPAFQKNKYITSRPLCCALQWLMFNEPLMKSFCTSITRNAFTGRTIYAKF